MVTGKGDRIEDSSEHTALLERLNHELRTPLNGILGAIEMLTNTVLQEEQKQYLAAINDTALALLSRFNKTIQSVAEPDVKQRRQRFQIQELIETSIHSAVLKFPHQQRHVSYQLHDLPGEFIGDGYQLGNSLTSVIASALSLSHQGNITISAKQINAKQAEQIEVCFVVEDAPTGDDHYTAMVNFSFAVKLDIAEHNSGPQTQTTNAPLAKKKVALISDCATTERSIAAKLADLGITCRVIKMFKASKKNTLKLDAHRYDAVVLSQSSDKQGWPEIINNLIASAQTTPVLLCTDHPLLQHRQEGVLELPNPVSSSSLKRALLNAIDNNKEGPPSKLENLHVLIVDDNSLNRLVLEGVLNILKVNVVSAENGNQAVQIYKKTAKDIDFIFMDCEMPLLNGYDATMAIREYEQQQHLPPTPIIALTAYVESSNIKKAMASGMDDYLSKPVTLEKIRHCLAGFGAQVSV